MLRTAPLTKLLAEYLCSSGVRCDSKDFVFDSSRKNPMYLGVSIGFADLGKSQDSKDEALSIFLFSRFFDDSFLRYISDSTDGGLHFSTDPGLISIRPRLISASHHFRTGSVEYINGDIRINGDCPSISKDLEVFDAILNRCLRPSWFYVMEHRSR